jgi:hypothetical protein
VLGCLLLQQDAIGAQPGPGENDFRLVCEFHFHPLQIVGRGADVRWPWWEKEDWR